ncbi:MAG: S41 family peptidase [Chloroflexi bacterium]|nr:S41 family peptidase [Chloroflexota bacterium]MCL5274034.1 S41 family peptidase [Chloroflexota bacterium]
MRIRSRRLGLCAIIGAVLLSACSLPTLKRPQPTPAISIDLPLRTQAQLRDYDLAVKAVRDQYLDVAVVANWQASVSTYRDRVSAGMDDAKFISTLTDLLSTLHDDDLSIVAPAPQSSTAQTQTAATPTSGIGILAGLPEPDKNRVLVFAVYSGSPAERAGIKPHDAIVKVDGAPVTYEERDTVLSQIRGQAGSKVTLTIHTPGQPDRDLSLTRQPITAGSTFESKRIPGSNIGYILPDSAAVDGMTLAVAQAIRDLSSAQELDGLVLDLRTMQNPQFALTDMLGLFVNGTVANLHTRAGAAKIEVTGKNIAGSQELPLVVLVSDETRGVAESYAGILQELGRARIIGVPTPGRLALITPLTLPNSEAVLLIPTGEFRGVKDQSWYHKGIKPDIPSDLTWEQYTNENDPQIQQALQALSK